MKMCSAFLTVTDDQRFCCRPADFAVMRRYRGAVGPVRPMCRRCALRALLTPGGGNMGIVVSFTVWRDQP